MYRAKQVARYIIDKCLREEKPVNNLNLQNMLYFMWIGYRKQTNRKLFDEKIFAWQFGPVVPEVYYDYCAYGGMDIDIRYDSDDVGIADRDARILDALIIKYQAYSVRQLVDMTRAKGKQWYCVYIECGRVKEEIPFSLIERMEYQ